MDWQYDATTVIYYMERPSDMLREGQAMATLDGLSVADSSSTVPDSTRWEGGVSAVDPAVTQAAPWPGLGINLSTTTRNERHDGNTNRQGDRLGAIVGQRTNLVGGFSTSSIEYESFSNGQYHHTGSAMGQETQRLPSGNSGGVYVAPTVEDIEDEVL
jgi:hypothetical protein